MNFIYDMYDHNRFIYLFQAFIPLWKIHDKPCQTNLINCVIHSC